MITCESCGKRYDYLKTEACPNCGAFNYVKDAHQHICGAEDVERIIEMKTAEHDYEDEPRRADTRIDQGLLRKYARARQKLDRLETTEDVFRTSMGGPEEKKGFRPRRPDTSRRDDRAGKSRSGCLKPMIIFLVVVFLLNIIFPLIFSLTSGVFEDGFISDSPSISIDPDYVQDTVEALPGASYTCGDLDFTVGDMALLDTGDTLPDQAIVLVRVDASCSLPADSYAEVSAYPYLSDPDFYYYYPVLDVLSPDDPDLIESIFGDYSYSLLQEFELSYMDGQEEAGGYLPFLVDLEDGELPDGLTFNLQMDSYEIQSGVYRGVTTLYTYPLEAAQTLTLEDAVLAYYNSSY